MPSISKSGYHIVLSDAQAKTTSNGEFKEQDDSSKMPLGAGKLLSQLIHGLKKSGPLREFPSPVSGTGTNNNEVENKEQNTRNLFGPVQRDGPIRVIP